MRKNLVLLAICICSFVSNAQNVGIGVPNPQNKLHVGGGFRLDTLTGVGGAGLVRHDANGVVYGIKFSGSTSDVLRGDGSFGSFNVNGSIGWLLNGNAGTNAATHFLGTTDDQPLLFKVNNIRHGYLGKSIFLGSGAGLLNTSSSKIGIGSGALGRYSHSSNSSMIAIGDSALYNMVSVGDNIAIGGRSMYSGGGGANIAIGMFSMEKNIAGTSNIAVGSNALRENTVGSYNVGIGYLSLAINTTGEANTAVGNYSLRSNKTGTNNTAVGYGSLQVSETGIQNTAMGFLALFDNKSSYNSAFG
jgi:hypothetical protein